MIIPLNDMQKLQTLAEALSDLCEDEERNAETEDLLFYLSQLSDTEGEEAADALEDLAALALQYRAEEGCEGEAVRLELLARTIAQKLKEI